MFWQKRRVSKKNESHYLLLFTARFFLFLECITFIWWTPFSYHFYHGKDKKHIFVWRVTHVLWFEMPHKIMNEWKHLRFVEFRFPVGRIYVAIEWAWNFWLLYYYDRSDVKITNPTILILWNQQMDFGSPVLSKKR